MLVTPPCPQGGNLLCWSGDQQRAERHFFQLFVGVLTSEGKRGGEFSKKESS